MRKVMRLLRVYMYIMHVSEIFGEIVVGSLGVGWVSISSSHTEEDEVDWRLLSG